jgi:hypothetical protein
MAESLRQIQMVYHPEEDRILLRLGAVAGTEFRFWLTRRFVRLLLRVLREHVETDPDVCLQPSEEARRAVREFKHEAAVSRARFGQRFEQAAADFPLGEGALLAYRLVGRRSGGNLLLGIHPRAGAGISLTVNRSLNASMTELLLRAVRQAQWDLPEVPVEAAPPATGPDRIVN